MAAAVQDPEEEEETSDLADISSITDPTRVKTSNFETSIKTLISQYETT